MSGAVLMERQMEVLRLVQRGATMRDIGAALGISSTNAISDKLIALAKKGAIRATKQPGKYRRLVLTPYGMSLLRLQACPTCHGEGTVPGPGPNVPMTERRSS